jgi:hypothetical protein
MTDADFSNKHLGASGATILAAFISSKKMKDPRVLSKLDLSNNNLRSEGLSAIASMLVTNTNITQLNLGFFQGKLNKLEVDCIEQIHSNTERNLSLAKKGTANSPLRLCKDGQIYKKQIWGQKCKNCGNNLLGRLRPD